MTPCFAAERTLGRLTKWLRLLGFDTLYQSDLPGNNFIDTLENDRILLTRTRSVRKRFATRRMIFVESDHLERQLKQIIRELGLTADQTKPFSRCLQCNVPIVAVSKNRLWGRIPDYIFETHDHFTQCPQCNRVFWPGSHTRRGLAKIRQLFDF